MSNDTDQQSSGDRKMQNEIRINDLVEIYTPTHAVIGNVTKKFDWDSDSTTYVVRDLETEKEYTVSSNRHIEIIQ